MLILVLPLVAVLQFVPAVPEGLPAASSAGSSRRAAQAPVLPDSLRPQAELFYQSVAWSPDGKRLAFTECAGCSKYSPDKWTLNVMQLDGSGRRTLVSGSNFANWSPDGRYLITAIKRDGTDDIYRLRPDGSELTRLTEHASYNGQPAWSPKGDLIAFASKRDSSYRIYVMNADGSSPRRLSSDSGSSDYNPAWSPDGSHVVFYRERGDNKDQIWTVEVATGRQERVTDGQGHNIYPSYLPDGRVGFHRSATDGQNGLVMGRIGEGQWQLVTALPASFARWSADGSSIVTIGGGWPRNAAYLLGPDGKLRRKLLN